MNIGRREDWPRGFTPPPTVDRPAGELISTGARKRKSWVCPGCRRGARSLWFGVAPSRKGLEADSDAVDASIHQPVPTEGASGALDGAVGELAGWFCRKCLGLVYPSQWKSVATRRVDRAKRVRRKLGGSEALYSGDPSVPPELALSTDPTRGLKEYDELTEELRRCELESLAFSETEFLPGHKPED